MNTTDPTDQLAALAWSELTGPECETLARAYATIRAWSLLDTPERYLTNQGKELYLNALGIFLKHTRHYPGLTLEDLSWYAVEMEANFMLDEKNKWDSWEHDEQMALLPMPRKKMGHKKTG